jgi:geranylgeranyl pyrophosphate synthase|tara:strand:- start:1816 stop:2697 length:882 start_codon:yes stop_codon:yes gene_type:complete
VSEQFLTRTRELIHKKILAEISPDSLIDQAMRYSVLSDSKTIRPALVLASGELNNNLTKNSLITLATAIELIHTYSLIHDDLPCMDDDDIRRGKESSHIKFGEANAILAGDALHDLAFEIISTDKDMNDASKIKAVNILANASGAKGMVLGQHLDIESEKSKENIDLKSMKKIHTLKTGKLIKAAVEMGQIESSLNKAEINMLLEFGSKIGLAFQIFDDILDETGETSELGKRAKSDQKNNKQTYVKIVGIDESAKIANKLLDESINLIDELRVRDKIEPLKSLAKFMVNRKS